MPPEISAHFQKTPVFTFHWITGPLLPPSHSVEWNRVVDLAPTATIFQRFEWISEWWRVRGLQSHLAVLLIRDDDKLVGIVPLYHAIAGRWRYLRLLGEGDSDYCGFVIDPAYEDRIWPAVTAELQEFCRRHDLHGLIAADLATPDVAMRFRQRGISHRVMDVVRCPYLPLPGTWAGFLSGVAKNKRLEIPRYLRRLEKRYRVSFRSSHTSAETREATLGSLFELHTRYWNQRDQPGAFSNEIQPFHRAVAASMKEHLRLYDLSLDGVVRAVFYGFFYKGKVFSYQTGVDPDFTQDRLGTLIFGHAIKETIEEGGREFDFARGDEPYKSQTWRAQRDRFNSTIAVPFSARSRVAFHLSRGAGVPGHGLRDVVGMLFARLNA